MYEHTYEHGVNRRDEMSYFLVASISDFVISCIKRNSSLLQSSPCISHRKTHCIFSNTLYLKKVGRA